jgi:uncharacterized protein (UPF0276 family)
MPLVGVGYRHEVGALIRRNVPPVEAVEVTVDHGIKGTRAQRQELEELPDLCPVFLHGVGLSLGTALDPDPEYLDQVRAWASRLRAPWYSEHLAFTKVPGLDLAQLLPLPRTAEVLEIVCEHASLVQERVGLDLLLENISYYFEYPDSELGEAEFLTEVCRRTGAGILLDLENLRINSINHGRDPIAFLAHLPPRSVRALHLAGGCADHGLVIDSHDQRVPSATFALLREVLARHEPEVIVVERDQGFETFEEALADVESVRHIRSSIPRGQEQAAGAAARDPGPPGGSPRVRVDFSPAR